MILFSMERDKGNVDGRNSLHDAYLFLDSPEHLCNMVLPI
jgi:hypothetical protein